MRYSQLFGNQTLRQAPAEAEAVSHRLLVRGQFIDKLSAGIYSFLPLGFRVHKKIEGIIRQEMNTIGGQEVFLPALQPKDIWEKTGRWDHMDPPLFKFLDRHDSFLTIGPTHEEVITKLTAERIQSYRDLPCYLYQIQNKFRNEMRSTGGLLRVREFVMKDLYSFHASEEDLADYYEKVRGAYHNIFRRCGFETKVVEASSGSIGGATNHEFMLLADTGEDTIIFCQKCDWAANVEKVAKVGKCPKCGGVVGRGKSIENGHIFNLGTKYSKALGASFTDKKGVKKPIVMGCYGIGVGRLLASIVEVHHDEEGIIWPAEVTPFKVHLILLNNGKRGILEKAESVYKKLTEDGVEVLYDDREGVGAGGKFADADLIGCPVRLVISEKTKEKIEWKRRDQQKTELLGKGEVFKRF